MTSPATKKLFLLDAYALIYRSYFAFIRAPRFNLVGLNTSAMLGFTNTLEQLLAKEEPSHLAVVFDVHAPTFRHQMYKEYKATREEMPEDLRKAIPWVRNIIEAYNIPIIEKEGFEADDVIGTLAQKAEAQGYEVFMMTPDKDYAQLVTDNIKMFKPGRSGNEAEVWGVNEVIENFEIETPLQVIDVLGLMGDAADNIPGCPGIGPKTAQKLITQFGSIDGIYKNINELKGKQKQNLIDFEEQVRLSRELVVIIKDVPIEFNEPSLLMGEPNKNELINIFEQLEFRSLVQKYSGVKKQTVVQGNLFDAPNSEDEELIPTKLKSIDDTKHQYILVETNLQRASLRAELSVQKEFCFDTETTSLDVITADLVCLSFSFKESEAYCVTLPKDIEEATKIVREFASIFADENIMKIGQNIKFDLLMLKQYGIEIKGELYDTMIAHYLINPDLRHNLDYLCEAYLSYKKVPTEQLIGKGKKQKSMVDVDIKQLCQYACEDADLTLQLKNELDKKLDEAGVRTVFNEIEMPLISVLANMEAEGMTIDTEALNKFAKELAKQIDLLEESITEKAGESFNLSSPKQLGDILFDKLKLDPKAKKTQKTQQYSTGEEVLAKLSGKHPIINEILEYRGLKKLLSTYVEALPTMVKEKTGKIHSTFNQTIAATGRLSSTNPNLQNIPIRDDNGKEIRRAFTASNKTHIFLSADYSQIELRIMAALSHDEHMLEAFKQGLDIHTATAAKIYKLNVDEVDSNMRRKAKTANFGIIYGISAFGLSQRLNISRTEAKELIDGYFESFPRIKEYMDESIEKARKLSYVETIKGRRRYLKDINSANAIVRGVAERNAINAPIQGSAADIIKIAMINIQRKFDEAKLQSKMILQVHDELNFNVLKSELDQVKNIVKSEMENAVNIGIPLLVEMNAAENWLDAH